MWHRIAGWYVTKTLFGHAYENLHTKPPDTCMIPGSYTKLCCLIYKLLVCTFQGENKYPYLISVGWINVYMHLLRYVVKTLQTTQKPLLLPWKAYTFTKSANLNLQIFSNCFWICLPNMIVCFLLMPCRNWYFVCFCVNEAFIAFTTSFHMHNSKCSG